MAAASLVASAATSAGATGVPFTAPFASPRGATTSAPSAVSPTTTPPDASGFVRVEGNRFILDGKPFHFVGANLSIMHHPEKRRGAEEVLTAAARDGIRVARVWAFGEGPRKATAWQRAHLFFRAGPSDWIPAAPEHLDRVLAIARRVGIRLIVCLSNHWADYGGVPQYLRWAGLPGATLFGGADRYYQSPRTRAAFRAHVERLLSRTNHVTGVAYRDDPTIFAWELMNESKVDTAAGAAARRVWIADMSRLVRRLAPNHLVSAGVSLYRLVRERREWQAVCALPALDFCDGHIYPEETLGNRPPELVDRAIDDFVLIAQHRVKKPFILGEFGVQGQGDEPRRWQGRTRAEWIARVYERLAYDAAAGGLLWIYQPSGTPIGGHAVVMGDPASEEIRAVVRAAAARLDQRAKLSDAAASASATAREPENPTLARDAAGGEETLLPLHAEVTGQAPAIPVLIAPADLGAGGRASTTTRASAAVSWAPAEFSRAFWEASGVYDGGRLIHAWGGETGWFEYDFEVPPPAEGTTVALVKGTVTVRARVSSEYPGTLSPPGGVSAFSVSIDGIEVGRAIAPRDDGMGRWVRLRSSDPAVLRAVTTPGRHRLRFTVADGPKAHGLCLYGRPGKAFPGRPDDSDRSSADSGFVELLVDGTR